MNEQKQVYVAIAEVANKIASEGISKSRNNQQQGYKFRGIDEIYNALAHHLADAGLVIIPKILSRSFREVSTKNGGVLSYVVVEAEYDFVSSKDGSTHTARVIGEAMDSADKATNKAMSAAYKYLCLQTFCIPTEGDNDADATTHERVIKKVDNPEPKAPEPIDLNKWRGTVAAVRTVKDLLDIYNTNEALVLGSDELKAIFAKRRDELKAAETIDPPSPEPVDPEPEPKAEKKTATKKKDPAATTAYNHKPIEAGGKPVISNEDFKGYCETLDKTEAVEDRATLAQYIVGKYSLDPTQTIILNQKVNRTHDTKNY